MGDNKAECREVKITEGIANFNTMILKLFKKIISVNFWENVLYFLITVLFLSSLGVWLPFLVDKSTFDNVQDQTWKDLPANLITYSVAIMMASYVERLWYLIKNTTKNNTNGIEFLILIAALISSSWFIYISYVDIKFGRIDSAIKMASIFTGISLTTWIYVKARNTSYDNFSALGGGL